MAATAWHWLRNAPWRRLCLLAPLIATGWTLYLVLPPVPRWRVPGSFRIHDFVEDGRVAVVSAPALVREHRKPREYRFAWIDIDSGRTLRQFAVTCSYSMFSPDFRVLAAGDGAAFWFIDAVTGRKTMAQGTWPYEESPWHAIRFSESGKWLVRLGGKRGQIATVFDTDRGSFRKQWNHWTVQGWFPPAAEQLVVSLKNRHGDSNERLVVWDADGDHHLATFGPYREWLGFRLDGRYVVGAPADDEACYHLLDLTKRDVILKLPAAQRSLSGFDISDNGRRGTFWFYEKSTKQTRVEIWDLHARVKRSEFPVEESPNQAVYSSDGSRVVLCRRFEFLGARKVVAPQVQVFDVASGRELWRQPDGASDGDVGFSGGDTCVGIRTGWNTFGFFDAATGTPCRSIELFPRSDWLAATGSTGDLAQWSDDRRYLVFRHHDVTRTLRVPWFKTGLDLGKAHEICVLDVEQQRVAVNLRIKDLRAHGFTTNGPTLLTCEDDRGGPHLTAWDVSPRKRWLWIVGGPALLGVVLLACGQWRRRSATHRRGVGSPVHGASREAVQARR